MTITEAIKNIPGGRFFSITYKSNMTPYMKTKIENVEIWKTTNKAVRTGVSYGELKSTKAQEPKETTRKVTKNWEWVIPNKIKYNHNTDKNYIRVATIPGSKSSSTYTICIKNKNGEVERSFNDVPASIIKQLLKESKATTPTVQDIAFENILLINGEMV